MNAINHSFRSACVSGLEKVAGYHRTKGAMRDIDDINDEDTRVLEVILLTYTVRIDDQSTKTMTHVAWTAANQNSGLLGHHHR